jgi:hypothetical protein
MRRVKLASLEAATVPEGQYRRLDAVEVAKLARAVDYAIKNKKPAPISTNEKRARRGRPR